MNTDIHAQLMGVRSQGIGPDLCFMCGLHIPEGSDQRTVEHVFPKWLLRKLDLWDGSVNQLDGRRLIYRRLTVPCCLSCNGMDLGPVEERVKTAFNEGFESFQQLDRRDLFIWLGKIYYGLIYRESFQPRDVRDQHGERLVPEEHLRSLAFHHFLLQTAAGLVNWVPELPGPASFHFFECLDHEDPLRRFDYMDDLLVPMLGLRMGTIGVVCVLQDWGRSEGVQQPHLMAAQRTKLHPTQFREVYGRISYMTKVSWKDNVHAVVKSKDAVTVVAAPPEEFAGSFIVHDFAHVMASLWDVPVEAIYKDGYSYSTLYDLHAGMPNAVSDHDAIFIAPHGDTGLWPAHRVDLKELGVHPGMDIDRENQRPTDDNDGFIEA